jgi:hypothetical protein
VLVRTDVQNRYDCGKTLLQGARNVVYVGERGITGFSYRQNLTPVIQKWIKEWDGDEAVP